MKWMVLILLGLTCSCVASDGGYWSFGVSRGVYGTGARDPYCNDFVGVSLNGSGDAGWLLAGILLLPLLLDVVLLPVTVTHDLFCMN